MSALPPRTRSSQSISTRIVTVSLLALVIVLTMIGGTLLFSWQLEGGAAAINDAGSLRMRAYRLSVALQGRPLNSSRAIAEIGDFEKTLASLDRGDPARPLVMPDELRIREQYKKVVTRWNDDLRAQANAAAKGDADAALIFLDSVDAFVGEVDTLVSAIERDNARKTDWLRLSQAVLIVIAIVGTVAMIYLLYLWIIRPVLSLQSGIVDLAAHRFDVRVPVETEDEFGALARGFNAMADEMQSLYRDLEGRVQEKTALLAAQNRELSTLYEMAAFLSLPNPAEAQCKGFMQRIMHRFEADAGALHALNPDDGRLHLVVEEGVPLKVLQSEQCTNAHACLCGVAAATGTALLRDLRKMPRHQLYQCREAGFQGIASFRIASPQAAMGSFTLFFRRERVISSAEMQLLETLGQQVGTALENSRLAAHDRLLAVSEERNLVAQGLHDSLAQSLNFLNLQVQMLERALGAHPHTDVASIVTRLKAGVRESYSDVRELLANFRTRLDEADIARALQEALRKFSDQTNIDVDFDAQGDGAPLQDEERLQVLFILQEALSNVRKHAHASHVEVRVRNGEDFAIDIRDNGRGFDISGFERIDKSQNQIGLHIMRERAERMGAKLEIESAPGSGTRVALLLPRESRHMM